MSRIASFTRNVYAKVFAIVLLSPAFASAQDDVFDLAGTDESAKLSGLQNIAKTFWSMLSLYGCTMGGGVVIVFGIYQLVQRQWAAAAICVIGGVLLMAHKSILPQLGKIGGVK